MDQGLNYVLGDDVLTRQSSSSSTVSLLSSVTSPLHLSDIASQPSVSIAASQPHPPSEPHRSTSSKASPLADSQPRPHFASSSSCTDTATQTMVHTGVQTEHYHHAPVKPSQLSSTSLAVSSQEYSKMEKLMATALLNAKDTINTIETLSQSLLLRNISREASLTSVPPGSYVQHVTYSQEVANNPVVSVANNQTLVDVINSQNVANNQAVVNTHIVTNSQDVANTPIQAPCAQDSSNLQDTVMTPPSQSHDDHVPQHNYPLYDDVTQDESYRLVQPYTVNKGIPCNSFRYNFSYELACHLLISLWLLVTLNPCSVNQTILGCKTY